nr:MAG TPA: PROTEIN/RNA Complex, archaeal, ribosomal, 50S, protein.0A [Caudoviricetes sp.]
MYKEVLERFVKVCEHNEICCFDDFEPVYESDEKPIEEALKKQIPQKPKDLRLPRYAHFFAMGDCPVCGRTVDSNEHYCFNCGQRLDCETDK